MKTKLDLPIQQVLGVEGAAPAVTVVDRLTRNDRARANDNCNEPATAAAVTERSSLTLMMSGSSRSV